MFFISNSNWSEAVKVLAGMLLVVAAAESTVSAQVTRGFDKTAPALATNEEIVRQPDVWAMEVQIKPIRLVWVEITDPQTKEKKTEEIWYLAWRSINRPVSGRVSQDTSPVNELDPLPGPTQFIPEFTLITYDNPQTEVPAQILPDQILPEAVQKIRQIERGNLRNTVAIVQDLPEAVPPDAENQPWIYGVATWRGVDPDTDFFKVILGGLSNAYQLKDTGNGNPQVWRKVLVQRFTRPGDRFDPNLKEFQFSGDPTWIYQPDSPPAAPL